jgi:hypothetical protein
MSSNDESSDDDAKANKADNEKDDGLNYDINDYQHVALYVVSYSISGWIICTRVIILIRFVKLG